jgi:hypothetical protein
LDRSAWRIAINVPEPWTNFFRVSSLAYSNLLGKKGYVDVDVEHPQAWHKDVGHFLGFYNVWHDVHINKEF